jgi:hypothetical protein
VGIVICDTVNFCWWISTFGENVSDFHGGECLCYDPLGCDTVLFCRCPQNLCTSSSGLQSKGRSDCGLWVFTPGSHVGSYCSHIGSYRSV